MIYFIQLQKGEIIQAGDQVDVSGGYNAEPKWQETICIGDPAPDPDMVRHRIYRRPVTMPDLPGLTVEAMQQAAELGRKCGLTIPEIHEALEKLTREGMTVEKAAPLLSETLEKLLDNGGED